MDIVRKVIYELNTKETFDACIFFRQIIYVSWNWRVFIVDRRDNVLISDEIKYYVYNNYFDALCARALESKRISMFIHWPKISVANRKRDTSHSSSSWSKIKWALLYIFFFSLIFVLQFVGFSSRKNTFRSTRYIFHKISCQCLMWKMNCRIESVSHIYIYICVKDM